MYHTLSVTHLIVLLFVVYNTNMFCSRCRQFTGLAARAIGALVDLSDNDSINKLVRERYDMLIDDRERNNKLNPNIPFGIGLRYYFGEQFVFAFECFSKSVNWHKIITKRNASQNGNETNKADILPIPLFRGMVAAVLFKNGNIWACMVKIQKYKLLSRLEGFGSRHLAIIFNSAQSIAVNMDGRNEKKIAKLGTHNDRKKKKQQQKERQNKKIYEKIYEKIELNNNDNFEEKIEQNDHNNFESSVRSSCFDDEDAKMSQIPDDRMSVVLDEFETAQMERYVSFILTVAFC